MPLTAVLVEDEAPARLLVRQYLADFPVIDLVAECGDGLSAVATIERLRPDLLFLDIQLPGLTGLEVLAQLTQVPPVIFSTAYDQYALAAFEAGAVDYLLKPYERSRFRAAVGRVLARAATPSGALQQLLLQLAEKPSSLGPAGGAYPSRLFVPQGARLVAVPVRDIHYVEAAGDYATLYTTRGQYLSNLGLSQLSQRLDPRLFQRIHRSLLVALDAISALERDGSGGYYATLVGGQQLRVSRSYAEALRPLLG